MRKPSFRDGLYDLRESLGLTKGQLRRRARRSLAEMWTAHHPLAWAVWQRLGSFLLKQYEVVIDEQQLADIHALDAEHPLVFLFSHRSYLDVWLLHVGMHRADVSPPLSLAGANLNFFPLGAMIRRIGGLFIRRDSRDDDVYRYVLRSYIADILAQRRNLAWSIEGGRTRTGKLRPPRYGALRYVVDAVRKSDGPEAYVVPVSVVYDQLGEVTRMTQEALGGSKRPEDLNFALSYILMQRTQGGTARVDFGDPLPLRERIAQLEADPKSRDIIVERVALSVCHRINRATPATTTAVVTLALLAAERALTLHEVMEELAPIFRYIDQHPHLPSTVEGDLHDENWVHTTLEQLVERGVLERFDGGLEPVYHIAPNKHLVAAFYRNTLIHFLVVRAIGEFAMFLERDADGDIAEALWTRAIELRELLKFEFFFSSRREFQRELLLEASLVDASLEVSMGPDGLFTGIIPQGAFRRWIEMAHPNLAHLVLRPFLDAYRVVADELAGWPEDRAVDQDELLERCLRVGQQRVLQKRLHSPESVTLEIFKNAFRLASYLGLTQATGPAVREERVKFAAEIEFLVDQLGELARIQRRSA